MERKLGEIFTYGSKTYQVVKTTLCKNCAFSGKLCGSLLLITGNCISDKRTDKTSVIFKEINNMEIKNNQLTIEIPEGMEIDLDWLLQQPESLERDHMEAILKNLIKRVNEGKPV